MGLFYGLGDVFKDIIDVTTGEKYDRVEEKNKKEEEKGSWGKYEIH